MAHTIYQTQGIVLSRFPLGEASSMVLLLTEEFGTIEARAQAIREEYSKLRYALQSYSLSEFSLVRGRDAWRVTGAREIQNIYYALKSSPRKIQSLERMIALLKRLLHGEGRNQALYLVISAYIKELASLEEAALEPLELVTALRLLYSLGYVSKEETGEALSAFVDSHHLSGDLLSQVEQQAPLVRRAISSSLAASHL